MPYAATFHTNGLQTLSWLLDANEPTPCLGTHVKPSISTGDVLDCEKRCKRYLSPSR